MESRKRQEQNGDSASADDGELLHYGYRNIYSEPRDPGNTDGTKNAGTGRLDPYWLVTSSEPFDVDEFMRLIRDGRKVVRDIE